MSRKLAELGCGSNEYREFVRHDLVSPGYWGYGHLFLVFTGTLMMAGFCLNFVSAPTLVEWILFPASFLFANFIEYVVHRFPMHRRMKGLGILFDHVLIHHGFYGQQTRAYEGPRDFWALLIPLSVVGSIMLFAAAPLVVLLWLVLSTNAIAILMASFWLYYLNYEFFHFASHAPTGSLLDRLPGMRSLARHHQIHHDPALMGRYNFNITWPLFDWIFGTLNSSSLDGRTLPDVPPS